MKIIIYNYTNINIFSTVAISAQVLHPIAFSTLAIPAKMYGYPMYQDYWATGSPKFPFVSLFVNPEPHWVVFKYKPDARWLRSKTPIPTKPTREIGIRPKKPEVSTPVVRPKITNKPLSPKKSEVWVPGAFLKEAFNVVFEPDPRSVPEPNTPWFLPVPHDLTQKTLDDFNLQFTEKRDNILKQRR